MLKLYFKLSSDLPVHYRGILLNLLSAFAFYFATFFLKLGSHYADSISHIFVYTRYFLGTLIIGSYILWKGHFFIPCTARKFVLGRSVFNILAVLAFYKSVEMGSVGQANVLNMTYPVFVVLFAGPILGEWPKPRTYFIVCVAALGTLLNFPFWETSHTFYMQPILYGLISALIAALAIISLRGAVQTTRPETVMFWMFIAGTVVMTPFSVLPLLQINPQTLFYMVLSALSGIVGQWMLARSYLHLDAPTGSIVSSSRIPIALLFSFFMLEESFNVYTIYGALLIAFANVLLALHSTKQKNAN